KTGAELLDAAGFDDAALGAGVEMMRLRGDIALELRVGFAGEVDGFTAAQGRARDKDVAGLLVQKHDVAVFGVDAFFHDDFLWACAFACWGRQSGCLRGPLLQYQLSQYRYPATYPK